MKALKINIILKKDGEIFIQNLPLDKGDEVEITLLFRPKPVRKTVSTAADLLRSDIVGLWKDRTGMEDSPEFARILRDKSQRRF